MIICIYISTVHPKRYAQLRSFIVVHSLFIVDVVGASPVGAAPTTSPFSTYHLASMVWANTIAKRDVKHLFFLLGATYSIGLTACMYMYKLLKLLPGSTDDQFTTSTQPGILSVCDFWKHNTSICMGSRTLTLGAEKKWPPFRRRHFQSHFREWKS